MAGRLAFDAFFRSELTKGRVAPQMTVSRDANSWAKPGRGRV